MSRVKSPLNYTVEDLEFSTRLVNILLARCLTVQQLYDIDLNNMARWKGVGRKSVDELRNWLADNPDPRPEAEKPAVTLSMCDMVGCSNERLIWSDYCSFHEEDNVTNPDQWDEPQVAETPDFVTSMQTYREALVNAVTDSARDVNAVQETRGWALQLEAIDQCIVMAKNCGVWV